MLIYPGDTMKRLLVILLLVVLTTPAFATVIEVPHDHELLQVAIDASSDGDTVLVDPGIYYGGFDFNGKHITLASHFLITGNEADIEATILDGQNEQTVLTIEDLGETDAAVIGFTIQNGLGLGDWPDVHSGGIDVITSSVWIDHCYIHDNTSIGGSTRGAGIYYGSEHGGLISNCHLWHNNAIWGATAFAVRNDSDGIIMSRCLIVDNPGRGEVAGRQIILPYSSNITIKETVIADSSYSLIKIGRVSGALENCTLINRFQNGIFVWNMEEDELFTVRNSIIMTGNGYEAVGISSSNWDNFHSSFSVLQEMPREPWVGDGCIDVDPLFRNTELADYRLTPDSPCIDTGDPDSPWDPNGTPADMGAIYYQIGEFTLTPQEYRIPANGGVITYDARVTSNFTQGSEVNFWTEVVTPNGVVVGPLETDMVYVPPMSEFVMENRTQAVPAWVPSGVYTFRAYIGRPYQVEFQLVDEFIFTKGTFPFDGISPGGISDWYLSDGTTASGDPLQQDSVSELPTEFSVASIYPNPFNSSATVKVSLPESSELMVTVFNASGQHVATLHDGMIAAGSHTLTFEASHLASGLYFVQATIPGKLNQVQKAMLVR
jgi:Secretion system C-terminal sorting domain/Right handed beta helix region